MAVTLENFQLVERARQFAVVAHGAQLYGDEPYIVHPDEVVQTLIGFGFGFENEWEVLASGYLHDTVEDTPATASELEREFNARIALWVWNVTGEGYNRKQRNASVYLKAPTVEESVILKLADRITNMRRSMYYPKSGKLAMYRKEYPEFRKALYRAEHTRAAAMWDFLDHMEYTCNTAKK